MCVFFILMRRFVSQSIDRTINHTYVRCACVRLCLRSSLDSVRGVLKTQVRLFTACNWTKREMKRQKRRISVIILTRENTHIASGDCANTDFPEPFSCKIFIKRRLCESSSLGKLHTASKNPFILGSSGESTSITSATSFRASTSVLQIPLIISRQYSSNASRSFFLDTYNPSSHSSPEVCFKGSRIKRQDDVVFQMQSF